MNFKKLSLVLISIFFSFAIYQKQVNAEEKIEYTNITEITDKSISYFAKNWTNMNYTFETTINFGGSYTYNNESYNVKDMSYVLIVRNGTYLYIMFADSEIYASDSSVDGAYVSYRTTGKYIMFRISNFTTTSASISKNEFGKNKIIVDNVLHQNTFLNNEWNSKTVYEKQHIFVGANHDIYYRGDKFTKDLIHENSMKAKISTTFVKVKHNYAADNRISSIDYNVFFGSQNGLSDDEKEDFQNNYIIKYSTDAENWKTYDNIAERNYMPYRFKKNETLYVTITRKEDNEIVDSNTLTVSSINKYYSSITDEYYDNIDEKNKMEQEYENSEFKDISTENTTENKSDILSKIKRLILNKLPILEQIPRIYNSFQYDNNFDGRCINVTYVNGDVVRDYICRPNVKIDLSYFGLGKIDVINFNYVVQYRDTIIKYQRFFMYFITFIALVKIVRRYFK